MSTDPRKGQVKALDLLEPSSREHIQETLIQGAQLREKTDEHWHGARRFLALRAASGSPWPNTGAAKTRTGDR